MIYDLSTEDGINRCKKRLNALANKKARAEVKEATDDGSDPQRKYFHAIVRMVARDRGYVFEKCKEALILMLGYYTEVMGAKVRQKTTEMSKKEYSRLIDDLFNWCIDQGYTMITAEEYLRGDFDEL
jgi:hypothetical protein